MSDDSRNDPTDQREPARRRGLAGRVVDAVVSPLVTPVIDAVDVGDVVDRIDVEGVVDRIDVDALMDRVDVERLLSRIDVDALLARIDVNGLLDRIDVDRLLGRIDVDALMSRVDVEAVVARVDVDALVARVDLDRMLASVDVGAIVDRVDLNGALERVDIDRLIDRVDLDDVVGRVDLNAALERVDVNRVVERTELGAVIARSTTGVFGELLDAARGVSTTADLVVQGATSRLVRPRSDEHRPGRPGSPDDVVDVSGMRSTERGVALQGHHAGSVSRFVAFLLDQMAMSILFAWGQWMLALAIEVVLGSTWQPSDNRIAVAVMYLFWAFLYFTLPLAVAGRTVGMAVLGLQVVRSDGESLDGRHAALRTVALPVSFAVFGLGLLLGLVRRDRRQLHDLVADTAVVYAWDAEIARLRADRQPD
jgi:uncharacterized RDD family membrane protein YckC